ncbi:Protein N-acetyltransferase, RimJ/RimL family [Actinokineospora alba]|uniref:Protein N-acetyltransferase, RimJ/RimL family n=1 Tax=Actinokineospora alba TaxID=504798 RepID=A0A1H0RTI0_9PSEU|nr:GNAT family protein [Actinokineospora alba]TDP66942.1 RimJ/RimL family protein N-acetyltransferase [Actinokineospora alba]SDJ33542.1 Protein N-acetyltransferase, RimJ/RimL family [Actinokineospora alba]SDP32276.1 Protein N-acetyltransferase, RimJ/RimL family [Actinokineospora alba]
MLVDHFPVLGLRLTTPRLELRLPSDAELSALGELAGAGIHDPDEMPFIVPWTTRPPAEVARSVIQRHWQQLGEWSPDRWSLDLAVFRDGVPVGRQNIRARELAVTREVSTGSWVGKRHHGQGIGTEMRAAVLHLAFAGLGAQDAVSAAFPTNTASHAVSRKLGYRPDGIERLVVDGTLAIDQRLRLTKADWERHRTVPVTIEGLDRCLPLFGIPTTEAAARP